jgi:hypothetical protein
MAPLSAEQYYTVHLEAALQTDCAIVQENGTKVNLFYQKGSLQPKNPDPDQKMIIANRPAC